MTNQEQRNELQIKIAIITKFINIQREALDKMIEERKFYSNKLTTIEKEIIKEYENK